MISMKWLCDPLRGFIYGVEDHVETWSLVWAPFQATTRWIVFRHVWNRYGKDDILYAIERANQGIIRKHDITINRCRFHDDVIKRKHFPRYWPFVRGIHRSAVNSSHKGQWRGALMFSFISAWINGWENNRGAVDLGRHRANYDVIVMSIFRCIYTDVNNYGTTFFKTLCCIERLFIVMFIFSPSTITIAQIWLS